MDKYSSSGLCVIGQCNIEQYLRWYCFIEAKKINQFDVLKQSQGCTLGDFLNNKNSTKIVRHMCTTNGGF
jgi:hypothetical protein